MTKVSYIQSIPPDEAAERGQSVQQLSRQYIPYLSLTTGEMRLELLRQRMQMFSRYYPDVPEYTRAVQMIDDVLKAGVHRGVSFVGAVPDELQKVALVIAQSVNLTQPAAGTLYGRDNTLSGIGAIIEVASSLDRYHDCIRTVNAGPLKGDARQSALRQCQATFDIERIYNDYLERIGHHTVYNRLSSDYPKLPTRVDTKRLLHDAGVEGMANAAALQKNLVSDWVENGVYAKNAAIGVGLLSSETTSFYLAPNPDTQLAEYLAFQKDRQGVSRIGIAPAAIAAIATAIAAVVGAAFQFLTELQRQKAYAMSQAQGFGTQAYSAIQSDWATGTNNPTTGQQNTKTLGLIAAAAGAVLLLNDE